MKSESWAGASYFVALSSLARLRLGCSENQVVAEWELFMLNSVGYNSAVRRAARSKLEAIKQRDADVLQQLHSEVAVALTSPDFIVPTPTPLPTPSPTQPAPGTSTTTPFSVTVGLGMFRHPGSHFSNMHRVATFASTCSSWIRIVPVCHACLRVESSESVVYCLCACRRMEWSLCRRV